METKCQQYEGASQINHAMPFCFFFFLKNRESKAASFVFGWQQPKGLEFALAYKASALGFVFFFSSEGNSLREATNNRLHIM